MINLCSAVSMKQFGTLLTISKTACLLMVTLAAGALLCWFSNTKSESSASTKKRLPLFRHAIVSS